MKTCCGTNGNEIGNEKNPQLNVEDEVIMIGWGEWGCLLTRMSAEKKK